MLTLRSVGQKFIQPDVKGRPNRRMRAGRPSRRHVRRFVTLVAVTVTLACRPRASRLGLLFRRVKKNMKNAYDEYS